MNKKALILDEPELEFRYGQRMQDPRDGLALFGPVDTDMPSHPRSLIYGLIGAPEGITAFSRYAELLAGPILTDTTKHSVRNWSHFPGFEAAFCCHWPTKPAWQSVLDRDKIILATREMDPNQRANRLVDIYLDEIKKFSKRDEKFQVLICIVPDDVYRNCRPQSIVSGGIGHAISKRERLQRSQGGNLFNDYNPEDYMRSVDFRRQLKARAMEHEIPIQIIRESTLSLEPPKSPLIKASPISTKAWYLSTALFYKAGGKPWRLAAARNGVCYLGIAFRRTEQNEKSQTACCAAQMFLDSGDGIVFLGEFGPWYSPRQKECHLTKYAAASLLSGTLNTYKDLDGRKLREIFLHSRSEIDGNEFEGYKKACPDGINLVGIRVQLDSFGLKLFRPGSRPVLRGTFIQRNEKSGYLWASGFKSRLETYDGFDVPTPLRIDIQHGDADIVQVAKDILGLTKLNYNTCRIGAAQPVTVGFSNKVGEILVSNPLVARKMPQFKYYI